MFATKELEYLSDLEKEKELITKYAQSDVCSQKQYEYCLNRLEKIDRYLKYAEIREQRLFRTVFTGKEL